MGDEGERAVATRLTRVLAIDDDASILDLIQHALTPQRGYQVTTATNGEQGLELYRRERPDCIIVDVYMPVMDGFKFLRAIRGDGASAHAPVIILSALADGPHELTGALSGVDEYMAKPFKPSALCSAIERVIQITPEERERRLERLAAEEHQDDEDSKG